MNNMAIINHIIKVIKNDLECVCFQFVYEKDAFSSLIIPPHQPFLKGEGYSFL